MLRGIALAFLCYALFSWNDATIKALGGRLPVFEIMFFSTLFSCLTIAIFRPKGERWRDMFRMNHPKRVLTRTACAIVAGLSGTYAFTTIPLAEAYALIFLSPIFVTLLSFFILAEPVGWRRLSAVGIGFIGILLVVKPGLRELHAGHLAAALCAVVSAISMIIMRQIGHTERRVSMVGVVMVGALIASGILTATDFHPVGLDAEIVRLVVSGVLVGFGQLLMLAATRRAPANRVAPAQYSQMAWAIVLGAVFYDEFPDAVSLAGLVLIVFSGLFTFLREDKVSGWPRRTILMRDPP